MSDDWPLSRVSRRTMNAFSAGPPFSTFWNALRVGKLVEPVNPTTSGVLRVVHGDSVAEVVAVSADVGGVEEGSPVGGQLCDEGAAATGWRALERTYRYREAA